MFFKFISIHLKTVESIACKMVFYNTMLNVSPCEKVNMREGQLYRAREMLSLEIPPAVFELGSSHTDGERFTPVLRSSLSKSVEKLRYF